MAVTGHFTKVGFFFFRLSLSFGHVQCTCRSAADRSKYQSRRQHHHGHGVKCIVPFRGWHPHRNHFKYSIRNRGGNINGQCSADQNLWKLRPRQLHDRSQLRRHAQVRASVSVTQFLSPCLSCAICAGGSACSFFCYNLCSGPMHSRENLHLLQYSMRLMRSCTEPRSRTMTRASGS